MFFFSESFINLLEMTFQYLLLILLYFKIKPFHKLIYATFLCDSVYNKRKASLMDPKSALPKTCFFWLFLRGCVVQIYLLLCCVLPYFLLLVLYPDRPFCSQIPSDLCTLLSPTVYFLDYIKHFCLDPAIFHNSCP